MCGDEMEETPLEHQSPPSSLQDGEETVSSISFYLPSYVPTSTPPPPSP